MLQHHGRDLPEIERLGDRAADPHHDQIITPEARLSQNGVLGGDIDSQGPSDRRVIAVCQLDNVLEDGFLRRAVPRPSPGERRQAHALRTIQFAGRAGNAKIRRGAWNEELFRVLEGFPDLAHDDEVDACSGALEMLNPNSKDWGYIEWLREAAEEKKKKQLKPEPPKTNYAIGSVQWQEERKKRRAADLARAQAEDKIQAQRTAAAAAEEA